MDDTGTAKYVDVFFKKTCWLFSGKSGYWVTALTFLLSIRSLTSSKESNRYATISLCIPHVSVRLNCFHQHCFRLYLGLLSLEPQPVTVTPSVHHQHEENASLEGVSHIFPRLSDYVKCWEHAIPTPEALPQMKMSTTLRIFKQQLCIYHTNVQLYGKTQVVFKYFNDCIHCSSNLLGRLKNHLYLQMNTAPDLYLTLVSEYHAH